MTARIEDYAMIGDMKTAALVGRDGSIDWFCCPRFDSAACFAALLGSKDNGRWLIAPHGKAKTTRCYRDGSMMLETTHKTETGTVRVIDFMPVGEEQFQHRAHRQGLARQGADACRPRHPLRLRHLGALGQPARRTRRCCAVAGPDRSDRCARRSQCSGKDMHTAGRFHRARRRKRAFRADPFAVASAAAAAARHLETTGRRRRLLA